LSNISKALVISTINSSGERQMKLDLYFLNQTIYHDDVLFTLRFYLWDNNCLSIGYHQKNLPENWIKLSEKGLMKIVRRPSGGGAVLHSGGITYAITFKKPFYNRFCYEKTNRWLKKSFAKLGLELNTGNIKKSAILENCFSSSYSSDLIDQFGYKRIGSAQYWKKGSFLQHGEIQLNPPKDLWLEIFKESSPPEIKLKLNKYELINYLRESFLEDYDNLSIVNINLSEKKYLDIQ
tara:strand:- start:62 stop:769 length:708 start_codon:yes stop_codon:yes gene_type:complete